MVQIPSMEDMLKSGVHFGHRKSKRNPKMIPHIFMLKSGVHLIHLESTQKALEKASRFVSDTMKEGGNILFVGTKKQAVEIIKKYSKECGMPSVTNRWLGGLITNFAEIHRLINKFRNLKQRRESGQLKKYTKKEQLQFEKEIGRLDNFIGGIEMLDKLPSAIYVVDIGREKTAVDECRKKGIPIIAMVDTNANPELVDYPIPANDDAIKSIDLITAFIAKTILEAKADMMKVAGNDKKIMPEPQA